VENIIGLKIDLGFISYPMEHEKILIREILEDRLVLLFPPGHPLIHKRPIDPRDLEKQPMIVHETGSAPRTAIDKFIRDNKISVNIPLEMSSNRAIKKAVEGGLGIALISRKVADEEIERGELVAIPLSDQSITRKFYMVYHRDKYISEIIQGLIDHVDSWTSDYMTTVS